MPRFTLHVTARKATIRMDREPLTSVTWRNDDERQAALDRLMTWADRENVGPFQPNGVAESPGRYLLMRGLA